MSNDPAIPSIIVERRNGVGWITFDRPEASNALTLSDCDAIVETLEGFRDTPPSAVVFTGRGDRAFSGGMHRSGLSQLSPASAKEFIKKSEELLGAIRTAPFPTVSAINGHCFGTGFGVAVATDIRIAASGAIFGLPELPVGLPCVCDIALLQQYVGLARAKEMILTGRPYSADQMVDFGFVNQVVPAKDLAAAVDRYLEDITRHDPIALAAQKQMFEVWQNTHLVDGVRQSLDIFAEVVRAKALRDGVQQ